MDLAVRTYDPKQIVITFGALILTGYAEGTFIQIKRNGKAFEKKKGADGTVSRVNKNAFDYEVSLTLLQTSPGNTVLSGLMQLDQISNAGLLPLMIKDLNGATLFMAPQAWISKDPDATYGNDISDREWTFETGVGEFLVGGN